MSSINFRIEQLVEHFSKGNKSDFGSKIGVNEANIRSYIAGTEPKFNIIEKIADKLEINYEWLLLGKGSMLKEEKASILPPAKTDLIPKVVVVDNTDNELIPLVPVTAQAGYLAGYGDPEYIETLPAYSLPNLKNGTYRMFQVKGDSMYPTLQNNSYVVGQFIDNLELMTDNRVYVVVTQTEGIIVKRVLNRVEKYGNLYCKSDNRDYPNISVAPEDIKEIWECKMHLSFEFLDPVTNYQKIADLEADIEFLKKKITQIETKYIE